VLLLQETWLLDIELHLLSEIHGDFYGQGISAMEASSGLHNGRPHGGLACLWRKSFGSSVKPCFYGDVRLMGLKIKAYNTELLIVNTYLPCSSSNNLDEFQMYLGKMDSIITTSDTVYSMIMGDFNSDTKPSSEGPTTQLFGRKLLSFCEENNLVLADYLRLRNRDAYTFVSYAHGTTSWLDHVVCTKSMDQIIQNVSIDYSVICSDHFPILTSLDVDNINFTVPKQSDQHSHPRVKWDKLSEEDLRNYASLTANNLTNTNLNLELVMCEDDMCKNEDHVQAIDDMYSHLITCLKTAAAPYVHNSANTDHEHEVPGWNITVKEHHTCAREAFLTWRAHGSPRSGVFYDAMKVTRAHFKLVLRHCQKQKDRHIADSLAEKLLKKDTKNFWNEVKKVCHTNVKVQATTINGATGENAIATMWKEHYSAILNSSRNTNVKQNVMKELEQVELDSNDMCTPVDVEAAICKLKKNKALGLDGIASEHFIYASKKVAVYLSLLFNCMMRHGHVPNKLMDTVLISLVKDKKGVMTDKNNYRPIAITCVVSKILELWILDKIGHLLGTHSHQFGFKKGHATDLGIFVMKEIIDFYNTASSPVYVCYIDATKAFDRVNHWILLDKLLSRNIRKCFVRLLMTWFITQTFIVKWGSCYSDSFCCTNGVRQGGILSPILFNVYVDELSARLRSVKIGCYVNNECMNHLFYADDAALLAPTAGALQILINICEGFARDHDMKYNFKKSLCTAFLPKELAKLHIPTLYLGNDKLKFVSEHKYLGVILNAGSVDDADISRVVQSLYSRGNMLASNFSSCSTLVKTQLFKSYCYSLYGIYLWSLFSKTQYKKVSVAYNDVIRKLFNLKRGDSISTFTVMLNINTFEILRRRLSFKFMQRILKSTNCLVRTIIESVFFNYGSRLYKKWMDCLLL
jgi:exonuclease III